MVFRGKCPLRVPIKSKPGKYGIKLWVTDEAKNVYVCNTQVYTGKSDGIRKKKQGLQIVKDVVRHLYGTGRGVTTDNFFTSYELANLLLTKNMTVVGTLRKNKPEIPALFLSGRTKRCPFCYLWFYQ